jgi:hypothetical protein
MLTIFFVFCFFVLIVPLGLATLRWLFKDANEVYDPQWELYQQRYD